MLNTNKIQIDGDDNITLQNIQGSTITIHKGDNAQSILPPELTINLPKIGDLSKIIGRDLDLQEVRDLLQEKQKVVVVNGLGGIGKTTLAQAYLTRYGGDYAHILWLSQSEGDGFVRDLITAPGLTHNLGMDTNGKDAQTLFTEIVAKLKGISTEKPNLLVIDNANTFLSNHFDYLPKPPQWHVLATSREKINRFETKDLDFLGEDDAVLLFRQHCQRITDEDQIKAVLRTVDYHTLTIEILAKTAQRHDTPLSTLQQAIERDLNAGVYVPHKGDKIEKVTSYLLSIFDLAALSQEEQVLLQHFAALPTEFVPYDLLNQLITIEQIYQRPQKKQSFFKKIIEKIFVKTTKSQEERKCDNIIAILQDLSDKGWLLQKSDPEAYKMHLIIAEVVKRKISPSIADLRGLIVNVANLLSIDQTKDNPVDKFPFVPYGKAVLAVFSDGGEAEISLLQNKLALVLYILGDYTEAKTLLEKAIRSDEANFGENHPSTAESYSNLAVVIKGLGNYTEARKLLEKAMRSAVAYFGENHSTTAVSYSNLATVLQDFGDYKGARELFEKAIRSDEANFGENHSNTARNYSNLALLLLDIGDYTDAKELLEKALRSDEANFDENHPTIALRHSILALALQAIGDYAGARELLEKALRSDVANFGENHPTTALRYSNLGSVLQSLGDYAGARELVERALRSDEANFGENHRSTVRNYYNLATIIRDLGEYEKAILLAIKAYRIHAGLLGQDHPNTKKIEGVINGIAETMLENGWTMEQIKDLIG